MSDLALYAKVGACVFGAVIAVRLLLTPYWLWKEQKERADGLQQRLDAISRAQAMSDIAALDGETL